MQVLMLSDVYFPRVNGVSTSIETFRERLREHAIDVALIAPKYAGEADEGDWLARIDSRRVPFDPEDRLMSYRQAFAAGKARRPDLIHIQTPFVAHYAGLALARWHGVPVLATYHTFFEEYLFHYVPLAPRPWLRGLARRYSRRQCNALDAVVVPSQAMRDRLADYGVTRPMHVLPTGIPLARFAAGDRAKFRQQLGIAADRPVALYVGRVAHEKNIDFLLEVARRCQYAAPELLWLVAGEGPALPSLKALASRLGLAERVRFVGYLDRARALPDCYAAADLFVFASKTETQGLVLLEAMAQGLPVVALAAMGTRDIVGPQRGAVTPQEEPEAFAAAVLALLRDPERRAATAAAARQFVREWSDQAMAGRLAELYRQIRLDYRQTPR